MVSAGRFMSVRLGLTSLSGLLRATPWFSLPIRRKAGAARALLMGLITTVTGCLVEAPPDFQRTRPFLYDAEPPVLASGPLQLSVNAPTTFSARVSSQEPDETIQGLLFLDQRAAASGFSRGATDREIEVLWAPAGTDEGCHWLTLRATYAGNWSLTDQGSGIVFEDVDLIDEVRWWVQVGDSTRGCSVSGGSL